MNMDKLFLGIKGRAVCVDKFSGNKIWDVKLKSTSEVTNILAEDELVFVYSGGHLFCLDIYSGAVKWENKLKGMGYGPCIMASQNQNASVVSSNLAAQQSSAAIAFSSSDSGGDGGD